MLLRIHHFNPITIPVLQVELEKLSHLPRTKEWQRWDPTQVTSRLCFCLCPMESLVPVQPSSLWNSKLKAQPTTLELFLKLVIKAFKWVLHCYASKNQAIESEELAPNPVPADLTPLSTFSVQVTISL